MKLVDAGRAPPTVGCRTRETERGERRLSPARGDSLGESTPGSCYEGSGCPTTSWQASAWRKTQLAQGEYVTGGELRDVKRPACFHRQTGACRSCGLAVSQPCHGHEEPVETTDAFRPTGGGRGAGCTPSLNPTEGAINSNHRTIAQRLKRSTPTARRVSSDGKRSTSNHRTGVQREKGLSLQPPDWTEDEGLSQLRRISPRCLRRTSVNSASAAFPRGRPGESESSSGQTRATGITHPGFLWSETLEKA